MPPRNTSSKADLDRAVAAASAWRSRVAEPQIAARSDGPIPPDRQVDMALEGKQMFDRLRQQLGALGTHIDAMSEVQLQRIQSAQRVANVILVSSAVVLILVIITALTLVQRRLTRLVNTLLGEVEKVADGDYDQPVHRTGPREIADLSEAVERMRVSLRAGTDRLVDGELRDEQARIAAPTRSGHSARLRPGPHPDLRRLPRQAGTATVHRRDRPHHP